MAFEYSIFISYRHHDLDKAYFENLNKLIKSEIFKATGVSDTFYDQEAIAWGSTWTNKIYSGIEHSYFFLPVWFYHYLHEKNIWCARELYHALKIEEEIINQLDADDREDFAYVFPLIYRGDEKDFPSCFKKRQAKSIAIFDMAIKHNKPNAKLSALILEIHNVLFKQYKIIEKYINKGVDFNSIFQQIQRPSDTEIIDWVKSQKNKEDGKFPRLGTNG
jgi:TIR domain